MKNTIYTFDFNKLFDFIFNDSETKNVNESEMVDVFETSDNGDLSLIQRQIREAKTNNSENKSAIRYDVFRMFIDIMSNIETDDFDDMTPLQKIVFNTLLSQNIIIEKQ